MKHVAYFRVSTAKQEASGLGLEAQEAAVLAHCKAEPLAALTEVESGKCNHRPQLAAALAYAKRRKATLVVAKLDRLSRRVAFIAPLMDSGVEFVRRHKRPSASDPDLATVCARGRHAEQVPFKLVATAPTRPRGRPALL